jgi:hypothetical protein
MVPEAAVGVHMSFRDAARTVAPDDRCPLLGCVSDFNESAFYRNQCIGVLVPVALDELFKWIGLDQAAESPFPEGNVVQLCGKNIIYFGRGFGGGHWMFLRN